MCIETNVLSQSNKSGVYHIEVDQYLAYKLFIEFISC